MILSQYLSADMICIAILMILYVFVQRDKRELDLIKNTSAENMLAHFLKRSWRTSYRMKYTGDLAQVQSTNAS
jgi:hypothetical protein